ncbi:Uncharacterised protein [Serratia quinivorans]|nr:Uncharacterised protein [Serratia quinivorans]
MIDRRGHQPAKCINFLNQMPFTNTANRRVARHLPQRIDIVSQ